MRKCNLKIGTSLPRPGEKGVQGVHLFILGQDLLKGPHKRLKNITCEIPTIVSYFDFNHFCCQEEGLCKFCPLFKSFKNMEIPSKSQKNIVCFGIDSPNLFADTHLYNLFSQILFSSIIFLGNLRRLSQCKVSCHGTQPYRGN